ncbi:hypothetical protein VP01_14786g1, partial [Puccinia sorghi]
MSSGKAFPTLEIQALAMQLGNNLETTAATLSKSAQQPTTATNPNAMNGRLSDSERVKMMQAGQCFQFWQ